MSQSAPVVESEALLEGMGYKPELNRELNMLGNLGLVLSDIAPTASLLVVGTAVIATAGTGSLWAYLIGGFIALNVALCMGELGSMFPVAATMLVGICGAVLCAQSSLISVVTFTSVLIIVLYALIAISAIVSRLRHRTVARPFKMPLWPVSPVIALVGVGFALSQQKSSDLLVVAANFGGGLIYYVLFLMPRRGRYWTH